MSKSGVGEKAKLKSSKGSSQGAASNAKATSDAASKSGTREGSVRSDAVELKKDATQENKHEEQLVSTSHVDTITASPTDATPGKGDYLCQLVVPVPNPLQQASGKIRIQVRRPPKWL